MLTLESALLLDDFSLAYIANHHARSTPFPFNVATAWAALEGSIVLWGLVLSGFTWVVYRAYARSPDPLGAGALAVMGVVSLFFFGLQATIANPFETCVAAGQVGCLASSPVGWWSAVVPADGLGPNPLLQNHILMAVHPPMLYLGFVGLTVPFAYAISALSLGAPGSEWLRRSRRSTLVAWTFLTLGIVLGGWWAYEVLSWGGYWAWDPVENASFLPWLTATAFVHSSLVQQRRGMLQAWNFALVIGSFSLTILGTFLTRSGTIASVHSFTQSAIGPALLGFLVVVVAGSLALFAARAHLVTSSPRMESLSSREGAFLFNNLILAVLALVVLVGTLYPMLLEAFSGDRVGVGRPFFDRMAVPLSFALLLAMGVGPAMPWRVARAGLVWERIRLPLQVALAAGAMSVLFGSRIGYVVLGLVLGTFIIMVGVRLLWVQARRTVDARQLRLLPAVGRVFGRDPGFWGGMTSHAGVALLAVGISCAANLADHTQVNLRNGETVSFAGYELTYVASFLQEEVNRTVIGAQVRVDRDDRQVSVLTPRLNQFERSSLVITSPAVHAAPGGDLYLTLLGVDQVEATLKLDTSPMQWLIWAGGLVAVLGGLVSLKGRRAKEPQGA
jgi:cytochrome c-type biogenesis protein CcmF